MTDRRMSIWEPAVALLLCLSPYGCDTSGGDTSGSGKDDGKRVKPSAATSAEQAAPSAASSAEKAPAASKKLFEEGPSEALADVKKKVGGDRLMVLQLMIFPTYLHVQVQDPNQQESVKEYQWRDGKVAEPTEVKLSGKTDAATIGKQVFDLSEADLEAVAKMAEDAPKRLEVEGGKVTHIVLGRKLGIGNDPQFRVYVSGVREDVSAAYDAKGIWKKAWK